MRLDLGSVVLDTDRRQVLRGGKALRLSPKAFQLFQALVDHRPRALSKDELQKALWPDTFVSDTSLTTLVNELRGELGESARKPRLIRTVHGYGYAFEGGAAPAAAGCRLVWGGGEIALPEGESVLGRDRDIPGSIPDASVSRRHAKVTVHGASAVLEDLGSKNGTWIAGQRVGAPTPLDDGDSVRIGLVTLVFRSGAAGDSTTRTAGPGPS